MAAELVNKPAAAVRDIWQTTVALKIFRSIFSEDSRLSMKEHARGVRRHGWALIVSGIGGVLGLIALTVPPGTTKQGHHASPFLSTWLWASLFVGGIFIAQFLSFHDVRKERDVARAEIEARFNSILYRFAMDSLLIRHDSFGKADGESVAGYLVKFVFRNGGLEVLEWHVEEMEITLDGVPVSFDLSKCDSSGGILLPDRTDEFHCPIIEAPFNPFMAGHAKYTVIYGHPSGGTKFRTTHNMNVTLESRDDKYVAIWLTEGSITHEAVLSP